MYCMMLSTGNCSEWHWVRQLVRTGPSTTVHYLLLCYHALSLPNPFPPLGPAVVPQYSSSTLYVFTVQLVLCDLLVHMYIY